MPPARGRSPRWTGGRGPEHPMVTQSAGPVAQSGHAGLAETEGRTVSATSAPVEPHVPAEIVSSVFHSATVSDATAILVAETHDGVQRISWGNEGAVKLLGYAVEDLRCLPVDQLLPSLRGGELRLLLRRQRVAQMTLPVRTASGATVESLVIATPSPTGRTWTMRVVPTADDL